VDLEVSQSQQTDSSNRKYKLGDPKSVGFANLSANIASTLQAGCFLGCFIASWVSDRFGRRTALIWAGNVTIVGCIIQSASLGSLASMYVGRYVFPFPNTFPHPSLN
jgi:MFS family permease